VTAARASIGTESRIGVTSRPVLADLTVDVPPGVASEFVDSLVPAVKAPLVVEFTFSRLDPWWRKVKRGQVLVIDQPETLRGRWRVVWIRRTTVASGVRVRMRLEAP